MSSNQNFNRSTKTEDYTNSSVHFLKGVAFLRVSILVILVSAIDLTISSGDHQTSQKNLTWAHDFVQDNNLLASHFTDFASSKTATVRTRIGETNVMNVATIHPVPVVTPQAPLTANLKVEGLTNEIPRKNPLSLAYMRPHELSLSTLPWNSEMPRSLAISVGEEIKRNQNNDWEAEYFPEMELPLTNKHIKEAKKWFVSGLIGLQQVTGDIVLPASKTYEVLTGLDEINTIAVGSNVSSSNRSYGMKFNLGYKLTKNWDVISGINHSVVKGEQTAYYDSQVTRRQTIFTVIASPGAEGTVDYEDRESVIEYTNYFSDTLHLQFRLTTLEVPLMIRYTKSLGKWNTFVSTGIAAVFKTKYQANYTSNEIENGTIHQEEFGINAVNYHLGIGVEYMLTKDMSVQLSPSFSKGVPIDQSSVFQTNMYNFGVYTGITYWFR